MSKLNTLRQAELRAERLRNALLETGMLNETFADWIEEGRVDIFHIAKAFENYRESLKADEMVDVNIDHVVDLASKHEVEVEYVLGFMFCSLTNKVLLILKNRPTWQAGRLNGIGGKIELGETPLEAMVREFQEETGFVKTFDAQTQEEQEPSWIQVGIRQREAQFDRQPGSYRMYVFACEFMTSFADHRYGGATERFLENISSIWTEDFVPKVPAFEEPINLPMNLEIIRRRGVQGLAWVVDAAYNAMREGSTFVYNDLPIIDELSYK